MTNETTIRETRYYWDRTRSTQGVPIDEFREKMKGTFLGWGFEYDDATRAYTRKSFSVEIGIRSIKVRSPSMNATYGLIAHVERVSGIPLRKEILEL